MAGMTLPLSRFGATVHSVFALAGDNENAATSAMGWALAHCPEFLDALLDDVMPGATRASLRIDLQRHGDDAGFTDIEIHGVDLHILIEAKVGISVPSQTQLQKYVARMANARHQLLVSVSDAPSAYAARALPSQVNNVRVLHRSWRAIQGHARNAATSTTGQTEKLWLRQLESHLEDYVTSRRATDNTVYIVSLSTAPIDPAGTYTWVDVVKEGCYFHPAAKGWPSEPPNYIGFRYKGKLQSIHRVEDWEIADSLRAVHPDWPDEQEPHFVYSLGPAMVPAKEVRSGPIWSQRNYAAIDLLLSGACATISDAVAKTKERLASG